MADATFASPVPTLTQAEYTAWFWTWFRQELMSVDSFGQASNHAAFVRANQHLKAEHWVALATSTWPPQGIPVFAPFSPTGTGQGGYYVQIRPRIRGLPKLARDAPKRRLHRLACATINDRLHLFLEDPSLEASHRLITFTGMERDFNANNLVPENGECE